MKTVFRPRWPRQEFSKKIQLRKVVLVSGTPPPPTVTLVVNRLATVQYKHILSR